MAIKVVVHNQDSLEKCLRILNDKCREAHIFTLIRKKEHYLSPSERKHKKKTRRSRR
jgi:ribosomal protein S21